MSYRIVLINHLLVTGVVGPNVVVVVAASSPVVGDDDTAKVEPNDAIRSIIRTFYATVINKY